MKTIIIHVEDREEAQLLTVKKNMTWKQLLMSVIKNGESNERSVE